MTDRIGVGKLAAVAEKAAVAGAGDVPADAAGAGNLDGCADMGVVGFSGSVVPGDRQHDAPPAGCGSCQDPPRRRRSSHMPSIAGVSYSRSQLL